LFSSRLYMLQKMHHDSNFILLFPFKWLYLSINLCFLWITPFVRARKSIRLHIGDVDAAAVACGFGRAIGNKVPSPLTHLLCMFKHHIFLVSVCLFGKCFCDSRGWWNLGMGLGSLWVGFVFLEVSVSSICIEAYGK